MMSRKTSSTSRSSGLPNPPPPAPTWANTSPSRRPTCSIGFCGKYSLIRPWIDDVPCSRAMLPAKEAPRRMITSIRSYSQSRVLHKHTILFLYRKPATMPAGAAAIRNERVAQHLYGIFGLRNLDWIIRQIHSRRGNAFGTVMMLASAPTAQETLAQDAAAFPVPAGDGHDHRSAIARRGHSVWQDLRKRPEHAIEGTLACHATRGTGRWRYRINHRAYRRDDLDRPHIAFAVRDVRVRNASDRRVDRRGVYGTGQLIAPFTCGAVPVQSAVISSPRTVNFSLNRILSGFSPSPSQ